MKRRSRGLGLAAKTHREERDRLTTPVQDLATLAQTAANEGRCHDAIVQLSAAISSDGARQAHHNASGGKRAASLPEVHRAQQAFTDRCVIRETKSKITATHPFQGARRRR